MLDKMGGIFAPKPSAGPHKLRESIPVFLILRNKLKYALDGREVRQICAQRNILVDGKIRTDPKFPAGFMDVVQIPKTKDSFRVVYDIKGRFLLNPIDANEGKFKLCKVLTQTTGLKKVPQITTHDGRILRYPDPLIKVGDTVKIDLETGKVVDFIKLEVGKLCFVNKGRNTGRIGVLIHREKHLGSFDIAKLKDAKGNTFAVRLDACFVIGDGEGKSRIALPQRNGVKLSIIEEKAQKRAA
jgi:small subunit ribosomal protein S4e